MLFLAASSLTWTTAATNAEQRSCEPCRASAKAAGGKKARFCCAPYPLGATSPPRTTASFAPSKFGPFPHCYDGLKECVAMDIPHELRDEFPQEISLIERMIRTNYEFRRLAERYDEVNRNIYRIESGEEPTTDEVLARLKKWRLKLKDEIAAILTKLENRM